MKQVSCEDNKLSLTIKGGNFGGNSKLVLFLPGGGKTLGKERFVHLQNKLLQDQIASASFDFSGVGGSSSSVDDSSLAKRAKEAQCVLKYLKDSHPNKEIIMYGVSMGGYIALNVVNKNPNLFSELILQAPAAYAEEAHSVNFNEEFTAILHEDESWQSSLSFAWLESFSGQTLFLIGEDDEIIPEGVTSRYRKIISERGGSKFVLIPDMSHNVWVDSPANKKFQDIIYKKVISFLQ